MLHTTLEDTREPKSLERFIQSPNRTTEPFSQVFRAFTPDKNGLGIVCLKGYWRILVDYLDKMAIFSHEKGANMSDSDLRLQ
jgi:hypothetical protein